MRVSRMETSANSAATKKALARISMATATNLSSERPCIWVQSIALQRTENGASLIGPPASSPHSHPNWGTKNDQDAY